MTNKRLKKQNPELLIFTITQLCVNLDQNYLDDLIEDLKAHLDEYIEEKESTMVMHMLTIMKNYFEKMTMDVVSESKPLVILSLELISYQGENAEGIYEKLGEFLDVG